MREHPAIAKAIKLSEQNEKEYFVVYEPDMDASPLENESAYHVCDAFDRDTFFYGCKVIYSTLD